VAREREGGVASRLQSHAGRRCRSSRSLPRRAASRSLRSLQRVPPFTRPPKLRGESSTKCGLGSTCQSGAYSGLPPVRHHTRANAAYQHCSGLPSAAPLPRQFGGNARKAFAIALEVVRSLGISLARSGRLSLLIPCAKPRHVSPERRYSTSHELRSP